MASLLNQVDGNAKEKLNLLKINYFNGYTFQTVTPLPQELIFFHLKLVNVLAVREEKKKVNKCNQCEFASVQVSDLRQHLKTQLGDE